MGGKRTPPPTTVAMRIVQARLHLAARLGQGVVTQAWLAKALGVSPGTVSQWEKGTTRPEAYDTLPRIAIALGTSPAWLAWGDEGSVTITNPRSHARPADLEEAPPATGETHRPRRGQGGGGQR